eukprot:COSAG06_NODE_27064_length_602_cov_0.773360_1_plen_141_part_00
MAKTKYNPRRRMTHISHARLFLKGSLHQGGEVQRQALETFRKFYRANDSKLEALLTENAELTIGRRTETFNSRCFFINGQPISVKLTKPTAHGIVANALRLTDWSKSSILGDTSAIWVGQEKIARPSPQQNDEYLRDNGP